MCEQLSLNFFQYHWKGVKNYFEFIIFCYKTKPENIEQFVLVINLLLQIVNTLLLLAFPNLAITFRMYLFTAITTFDQ